MLHVSDDERRRRLAVRHALAPAHRVASPEAATRAMTALHATEPATVHLSCRARCAWVTVADVERGLHDERSLVKQLAMRRTVFVFPRDLLSATWPSASARVARAGHWRTSRPRWTLMRRWLGDVPPAWGEADGWRELVRRWLRTFGPGIEDDAVWWLGANKGIVRAALAELDAVAVTLDSGATGWMLPDDLGETPDAGPWVALLPVLDPTVMGWKERGFYLGRHREQLFDRAGNAGTTAWVDGRIVGCWVQDDDGIVAVRLLEPVPAGTRRALDEEAQRLTAWLDGQRVTSQIRPPAMQLAVP